ncbi:hypothetical protein GH714_021915 [Hevea brasiliensis]|uniref:NAC domain-containing protein n=1 Tax=Hevea brasiliensis TaxID=3981 RepID=A0A6A6NJC7_HEVBR|nr:hypothetical protein GH714_021915 [Hevea brasiliensis]
MVLGCKKGKSSKKARIDLSNCNKASASTFEKQNLEIMANSACGEDEPPNHMTSDYESQSPNKMASTYDIGESCYRSCPTFEYEDLYDMSAFSTSNRGEESFSIVQNPCGMSAIATYNKGEECLSMTQTPYGVNNVSTCNKVEMLQVETSCPIASDLEYQNPNEMTVFSSNEKCTPGCQWASGVENQSTYEITTVSTYDKDETSSLMDFHFENQNWFKMTSNSSYDKGKPTNLLDFGSQNPSMNCNISVSEEGEWSHLNRVPSYFENQNQYKNTDNSIPGNYWSQNPSMNSDISVSEEGERIHLNRVPSYFENQNQYENTDKSIPGNYWSQYPSMNSNISVSEEGECCHLNGVPSYLNGVPSYFENQNQYENTDNSIPGNYWSTMMASNIQDTTFQEVQSQHKDTDVLISEGHLSPLVDIDVGEYSFSEKDSQLLKEIFARDEQEDTGCSVLQQPIHNKENHSHSGFGTTCPPLLFPQNLPVGWRFHPSDEELVDHYLKRKRLGEPIHGLDIGEEQVCDYYPWDLPGRSKNKSQDKVWYFFCPRQYHKTSGLPKRKANSGYWKSTGDLRVVTPEDSDEEIGTKRTLVFHNPDVTPWVIHEYEYTAALKSPIE